jgi:hypothetical protein
MSQDPRFNSPGDEFDRPYDLDGTESQFRSYHPARSLGVREDYDPVPLFLSDSPEVPMPRAFGRERGVITRRPIRTSIVLIAAAVTCYAVLSVKNPFPVFANATATLIGMSDVRSTPVPSAPAVQPVTSQPVTNVAVQTAPTVAVLAAPSVPAPAPAPREMPTRDEIALAIRSAHQSLAPAEIRQPVAVAPPESVAPPPSAPPVSAPPARKIGADELATLMTRAKGLLAAGDIPSARLLLERAADAQEPSAALMLAQTYDPAVLGTRDTRNINTDPALARTWYQRAAQLGSSDAQRRLSQLQ